MNRSGSAVKIHPSRRFRWKRNFVPVARSRLHFDGTGSHRGIITSRAGVDFISASNSCSACVLINTTSALYRLAAATLEI